MGKIIEVIGDGNGEEKDCLLYRGNGQKYSLLAVHYALAWIEKYFSKENGGKLTITVKEETE